VVTLRGERLIKLLEEMGYVIPQGVRPIEAYIDEYGETWYKLDLGGGVVKELIEDDLHTYLTRQEDLNRPDPLDDPELAELVPSWSIWDISKPRWLVNHERRSFARLAMSWYLPENAPDWVRDLALRAGVGPGLSNGPYRAVPLQDAKNGAPVDNSEAPSPWLSARITYRPGTLKVTLSGKPTPLGRIAARGRIAAITPKAKRRFLEFLRELEASNHTPEVLITVTYGSDWHRQLGRDPLLLDRFREKWKELDHARKAVREARRNAKRMGTWPRAYDLILAHYQELRREVRVLLHMLRVNQPDGRLVKRHLDAFIKRLDRHFGTRKVGTYPTREAADAVAEDLRRQYPAVRVHKNRKGGFDVIAVLYRLIWWMEFQRRGAPHLHLLLFDTHGIDVEAVRAWAGPAWAGVVNGVRNMAKYLSPEIGQAYDNLVTLWGKRAGEALFEGWLAERGLDFQVWRHMRAGTRVEVMQKQTWGYAAKEGHGGRSKAYQKRVPKQFQNIGRWWGYRNYKRHRAEIRRLPMDRDASWEALFNLLDKAVEHMPKAAYKYREKLKRFKRALAEGETYGYITLWSGAASAAYRVVKGVAA